MVQSVVAHLPNFFVNTFTNMFNTSVPFAQYIDIIQQTFDEQPSHNTDFWYKLYQQMKADTPEYSPMNCSTYGIINFILLQNSQHLQQDQVVDPMTDDEIEYISGRAGAPFVICKQTNEQMYIGDVYKSLHNLDTANSQKLFEDD